MDEKQNELVRQFIVNVKKDQAKPALENLKQLINLKEVERTKNFSINNNINFETKEN